MAGLRNTFNSTDEQLRSLRKRVTALEEKNKEAAKDYQKLWIRRERFLDRHWV
eukprot:m.188149 g.188149  ORF g.188149 m.188149 type:complete len:53 (+) comp10022_c3_seq8:913-1071(+)